MMLPIGICDIETYLLAQVSHCEYVDILTDAEYELQQIYCNA